MKKFGMELKQHILKNKLDKVVNILKKINRKPHQIWKGIKNT